MSIFNGSNPNEWILKVERYFTLHRLANEEKLEAAVIGFEEDALLWYRWENKKKAIVLWD